MSNKVLTVKEVEELLDNFEPLSSHEAIVFTVTELIAKNNRLKEALSYMIDVRNIRCFSVLCKSGHRDEFCAYHKAMAELKNEER